MTTPLPELLDLNRVAIVNRGEPAMRLIHAVREYNRASGTAIETVALLTAPDADSLVAHEADHVVWLPVPAGRPASAAYLDLEAVLAAIGRARADAVWVGWGFLAESPAFATAVLERGLVFIGPTPAAMALAGDKIGAKRLAEAVGVPVVPWSGGPVADLDAARAHAERIGYPVIVKAAAGGGGRGIRVAGRAEDLAEAFTSARLEAARSFGDDAVFVEACVARARHLEVQIAADAHGAVTALGVRDCTVQRRHQKLFEEAPGPITTPALAAELEAHATAFARAAGYLNVGTVELLYDLDRGAVWFMEMNARLQVEHTVTEEVYGVDLVKLQLDLARGAAVPPRPAPRGYAIEARLNAEDGEKDDAPAPGRILRFRAPRGPGVRIDTGVAEGSDIPADFDSMVAKIIARGQDRAEAVARLRGALDDLAVLVEDGATNKGLLVNTLAHPDFQAGELDTGWLDRTRRAGGLAGLDVTAEALLVAAVLSYREGWDAGLRAFYDAVERGVPQKLPVATGRTYHLGLRGHRYAVDVFQLAPARYRVYLDGAATDLGFEDVTRGSSRLVLDDVRLKVLHHVGARAIYVEVEGQGVRIAKDSGGGVLSPAPAMVIALDVAVGDTVTAGQRLATLESMKMEIPLRAPEAGRVEELLAQVGQTVHKGDPLVVLSPLGGDDGPTALEAEAALRATAPATADPFATLFDANGAVLQRSILSADSERIPAIREAVLGSLHRVMMGWDLDLTRATRLERLLSTEALWEAPLFADDPGAFAHALVGFADLEWALSRRHLRGVDARPAISMHSAFFHYARAVDRGADTLREDYRPHLERALSALGVTSLAPSPALREAVCRIAIAHDRQGARPGLRFSLATSLVQLLAHLAERGGDLSKQRRLERALLQLRALDEDRWLTLADHAARAHHLIFQKPRFEERASALSRFLEEVLVRAEDDAWRADATQALVDAAAALTSPLVRAACARRGPARRAAGEAVLRRLYSDRELARVRSVEDGALLVVHGLCPEAPAGEAAALTLVAAGAEALGAATKRAAAEAGGRGAVDVVVWADRAGADPELFAAFEAAARGAGFPATVARVTLVVAGEVGATRALTLAPGPDGLLARDPGPRDLHPAEARRLEIWRLSRFELERLPSHEGLHVFRGAARDDREDVRVFVLAETRDVHAGQVLEGAPLALFTFEHALREAVQALRQVQAERGETKSRYHWNQIVLVARPAVAVSQAAILDNIRIMPVDFKALGLERLVMRGRLVDPEAASGGAAPEAVEINVVNPTGQHVEVRFEVPAREPVAPASAYDLKVQRTRRLDVTYLYEIIRLLTAEPDPGVAAQRVFPPGDFAEYDLAEDGATAAPVERAPGLNRAAIVFGLVRHFTAKHPEGMERVLVLSDPLMGLGALAEAECRRLLAAFDLAEARGVPLEWVPVSSGARIAMDTGTENLDWTARVLRRIIRFTQAGGTVHVVVDGLNVGAQSYFNAEATMLMHTRGALIMTRRGAMVLTGKRALDFSGSVSAQDELGIGGFERVMGPNGQAQLVADHLAGAFKLLFEIYRHTYVAPGERRVRPQLTADPADRDPMQALYPRAAEDGFARVGDVFGDADNRERKRPFDMRAVLDVVRDGDSPPLERFAATYDAETAIVWDAHLGGEAVCLIGFESRPLPRHGEVPGDGPDAWAAGTLFPQSSKKVARALNAASGQRPVVVLANLSGFDGSPESMRKLQLEYGAEIGRAIVNFEGPVLFCVIGRYHGGAYVVFSKVLNPGLSAFALEGAYASVIGGAPAAAVVFPREVRARTLADPRVAAARRAIDAAAPSERRRLRDAWEATFEAVRAEKLSELAREFDAVHNVQRALAVGSLDAIIAPSALRAHLCSALAAWRERDA